MAATPATAPSSDPGRTAFTAAALGLVTTLATGAACAGPFVAILLGVGGFGWLTRYAYLREPATALTVLVLGYGFYRAYRRPRACCGHPGRGARLCLWSASVLAIVINVFEYIVLPQL